MSGRCASSTEENDDNFIAKGMDAMSVGKLRPAIEMFSKALIVHRSDTDLCMRAWEGRASCYEKLREYELAQVEARTMISAQPACHRGYLRMGKILRLQKNREHAFRIYQVGFQRTGHAEIGRQIESMRRQHEKEQEESRKLHGSLDIFVQFPAEVIMTIFKYLPQETIEKLCQCNRNGAKFRCNNTALRGLARFTLKGSANFPAIRSCQNRNVTRIFCSSQTAFKRLAKGPSLETLRILELKSLDLTDADGSFGPFGAVTRIRLIRCIITPNIIVWALRKLPHLGEFTVKKCCLISVGGTVEDLAKLTLPAGNKLKRVSFTFDKNILEEDSQYAPPICLKTNIDATGNMCRSLQYQRYSFAESVRQRGIGAIIDERDLASLDTLDESSLTALHIFCNVPDLGKLLTTLFRFSFLEEVGIFYSNASFKRDTAPIDPKKVLDALNHTRKRLICVPFLNYLSHEDQDKFALLYPKCRIIFDSWRSFSIANRKLKIQF